MPMLSELTFANMRLIRIEELMPPTTETLITWKLTLRRIGMFHVGIVQVPDDGHRFAKADSQPILEAKTRKFMNAPR
jgi:hypothetical protein